MVSRSIGLNGNVVNRHTYKIEFYQIKPMASTIILDSTQGTGRHYE